MFGRYRSELVCLRMALAWILCACMPPAVEAVAPFWPEFHGPRRDNMSTETGLLRKWPEGGSPLVWTARGIGHGFSSVAIADGRL